MKIATLHEGVSLVDIDATISQLKGLVGIGSTPSTPVFLDTETTGTKSYVLWAQITEIAVVVLGGQPQEFNASIALNPETTVRMAEEDQLVAAGKWPADQWTIRKVLDYNHYSGGDLGEREAVRQLSEIITNLGNPVILAYSARFDMRFVNSRLKKYGLPPLACKVIDVYKFVKMYIEPLVNYNLEKPEFSHFKPLWDEKRKKLSYSLEKLGKVLAVPTKASHSAVNDIKQTIEVLRRLLELMEQNRETYAKPEFQPFIGRSWNHWREVTRNLH